MAIITTEVEAGKTPLSAKERSELDALEATIRDGLQTFYEVGSALRKIGEQKLYRESFSTWEEYLKERWSMSPQRAHQLTRAAEVRDTVSTIVDVVPQNEAQARELARITDPESQAEAWQRVVSAAEEIDGEKHIRAKDVAKAVREVRKERHPDSTMTGTWAVSGHVKSVVRYRVQNTGTCIGATKRAIDDLARILKSDSGKSSVGYVRCHNLLIQLQDAWRDWKKAIGVDRKANKRASVAEAVQ